MEGHLVDQGRTRTELESVAGVATTGGKGEGGDSNLIGQIRREIRAEILMEKASNAHVQMTKNRRRQGQPQRKESTTR